MTKTSKNNFSTPRIEQDRERRFVNAKLFKKVGNALNLIQPTHKAILEGALNHISDSSSKKQAAKEKLREMESQKEATELKLSEAEQRIQILEQQLSEANSTIAQMQQQPTPVALASPYDHILQPGYQMVMIYSPQQMPHNVFQQQTMIVPTAYGEQMPSTFHLNDSQMSSPLSNSETQSVPQSPVSEVQVKDEREEEEKKKREKEEQAKLAAKKIREEMDCVVLLD